MVMVAVVAMASVRCSPAVVRRLVVHIGRCMRVLIVRAELDNRRTAACACRLACRCWPLLRMAMRRAITMGVGMSVIQRPFSMIGPLVLGVGQIHCFSHSLLKSLWLLQTLKLLEGQAVDQEMIFVCNNRVCSRLRTTGLVQRLTFNACIVIKNTRRLHSSMRNVTGRPL